MDDLYEPPPLHLLSRPKKPFANPEWLERKRVFRAWLAITAGLFLITAMNMEVVAHFQLHPLSDVDFAIAFVGPASLLVVGVVLLATRGMSTGRLSQSATMFVMVSFAALTILVSMAILAFEIVAP